ncbi:hypothetical protein SK128_021804, partial [Halocaridina rubra]
MMMFSTSRKGRGRRVKKREREGGRGAGGGHEVAPYASTLSVISQRSQLIWYSLSKYLPKEILFKLERHLESILSWWMGDNVDRMAHGCPLPYPQPIPPIQDVIPATAATTTAATLSFSSLQQLYAHLHNTLQQLVGTPIHSLSSGNL